MRGERTVTVVFDSGGGVGWNLVGITDRDRPTDVDLGSIPSDVIGGPSDHNQRATLCFVL